MSRQRLYQLRQIARGLCSHGCGRPIFSSERCLTHFIANRQRNRHALGLEPKTASGPGRPVLPGSEEL